MLLPDEGDAFELSESIALHELEIGDLSLSLISLSQHEVEDKLLPPEDDALNDVE